MATTKKAAPKKTAKKAAVKKTAKKSAQKTPSSNGQVESALEELFLDEIKDIYWAEKKLTKTLPKLQKAATSEELQSAFETHLEQTKEHVSRLEQVFELLGRGQSTSQIARRLRISISTVETHRAHLKEKLQTRTGPELVYRAVEWVGRNRT